MKTEIKISLSLIVGAVGVMIPFTLLTSAFHYPEILREDPGVVLQTFFDKKTTLIPLWWSFAMLGMPLFYAYLAIGSWLEKRGIPSAFATNLGLISLVAQMIGLLRWTFVVPVLADAYVNAGSENTREAVKVVFQAVHQYGGVVLGEHIGQLFTLFWTALTAWSLVRIPAFPRWLAAFGWGATAIYALAQLELFATVLPGFPVWEPAGAIGSTMWLIWLVALGVWFWQKGEQVRPNAPLQLPD